VTVPTLIFDCDGVLADTEQFGHLPAFNQTFKEFGLPVRWDASDYELKLKIGGGKERMASLLTPEFVHAAGLPSDAERQAEAVAQWHRRKTEIYTSLISSGVIPPRPGVARIAAEADEAGWQLGVASTSAAPSVLAVLEHAVGKTLAARFQVFAGDVVPRKKPAPDIYEYAIAAMEADPIGTVVIEDSGIGVRAAVQAGLRTIVTVSGYTGGEDFSGASLVLSSLGDPPPREPMRVIADPHGLRPGTQLTVAHLTQLLDTPNGASREITR